MKKLFTVVAALLFAATVWAQSSNPKMSYQAVIRNANNELVTSQTGLTVEITIVQADTVAYKESHTNVSTNQNGLVSLLIGNGTVNKGDLKDVDWTKAQIETKINGVPDNAPVTVSAPVTAVPYAIYADAVNPNSTTINNIYNKINDTLNNYYTKAKVNDTLNKYYTKTKINDTLNNYYTKTKVNDTLNNYYTKAKVNDTLKSYLTITGLCDSIENNCDVAFTEKANIFKKKNTFNKKVILKKNAVQPDGSIAIEDSLEAVNATDLVNYTGKAIHDSLVNYTIGTYVTTSELNTALENYYTSTEIDGTFENYYTSNEIDDTLGNYATINQELALTIKGLSHADSTNLMSDTTLTIPVGFKLDTDHLIKLYINGVYVGDNTDGVLVRNGNKVKYIPSENGNYELVLGDRVKIVYWVKK